MSVSYTLRMPDDLKRLCDEAAKSGGFSTAQLIVEACWKYLDKGESNVPSIRTGNVGDSFVGPDPGSVSNEPRQQPVSIEVLRAICVGEIIPHNSTPVGVPIEVRTPLCPKIGYSETDGESYRCSLSKGHKMNCRPGERVDS